MRIERFFDELASETLSEVHGVENARALLRPTQDPKHGDYQMNGAMPLAKQLKKAPREIAEPVAEKLAAHPAIESAEVAGPGFINLRLSQTWVAEQLTAALSDPRDGIPEVEKREKVVVDFSSPNIAKQMHVGHLRSTIIGHAIVQMLRFVGHDVTGDNHLGDWGTQFGLLIVGMREWGDEAALAADAIVELERVYKLASARAKEDEAFAESARQELAKLQGGDEANIALWTQFVSTTRTALDKVYARLNVTFDEWMGESAYNDMLPGVVQALLDKGIAREDGGAICVFWKEQANCPKALKKQNEPFIVRKKDGAFLYSTTDIATVQFRAEKWRTERAIYVVDTRQGLHFKQLFGIAELLGYDMRLEHVGFGTVLGEDGKPIKTRDGKAITLASLLDEAEARAKARIEEGISEGKLQMDAAEVDEVARRVGIGAVKYADLKQNRTSDYMFDWDKMVSFSGNAGPYLQYAYARANSIFRKGDTTLEACTGPIVLEAAEEVTLGRELLKLADVVHTAAETCQPHLVAEHLYNVARAFSAFLSQCNVLKSEGAVKASRLALVASTAKQLRRGLDLLGIEVVERM